jgi:hypothetical protein
LSSLIIRSTNWIKHVIKFARVHSIDVFLILHLLHHFINARLFKVTLPEFNNPLISSLDCLFS